MPSRSPDLNDQYQRPYGMPRPAPTAVTGAMDRSPATKPRRQRSRAGSRPNAALQALYRKRLEKLIIAMHASIKYWMVAAYREHEPIMAQDGIDADAEQLIKLRSFPDQATPRRRYPIHSTPPSLELRYALDAGLPAALLKAAFDRLRRRWEDRFDDAASKLARWFAQSAATRSDERLRRILKDGGLSVRFTPTKAMRDVMEGTVQANVALIKSIPSQYLTQVEGMVMRSVQTGRDLHQLSNDLRHELGVTKKRAAFIAIDQNNKANASMTRVRQVELGIKQAVWVHSHAGKTPRKTHLANDGQSYDVERGWFDPDPKVKKRIFPGELPRCRCFSRSIIPGFKP